VSCSDLIVVGTVKDAQELVSAEAVACYVVSFFGILFLGLAIWLFIRRRPRLALVVLLVGLISPLLYPSVAGLVRSFRPYRKRASLQVEEILQGEAEQVGRRGVDVYYDEKSSLFADTLIDHTNLVRGKRYLLFLAFDGKRYTVAWRHWAQWDIADGKAQTVSRASQRLAPVPRAEFRKALASDPPLSTFPVSLRDLLGERYMAPAGPAEVGAPPQRAAAPDSPQRLADH